jgi:uncharacterized surface protein with fasciclin (FAS1) repeats
VALLAAADFPADFDQLAAYTLFVPTNQALSDAGIVVQSLIDDLDPTELFELLTSTVAEGRFPDATQLPNPLLMVSGFESAIVVNGTDVTIDGALIVAPPTIASNGVIHALATLGAP